MGLLERFAHLILFAGGQFHGAALLFLSLVGEGQFAFGTFLRSMSIGGAFVENSAPTGCVCLYLGKYRYMFISM